MPAAAMLVQEAALKAGTAQSSVVTLINSAVGAGVLSLPYALRCTGWAAGLACIAGIATLEGLTLFVLSKLAEHTGARSYTALVHQLLGKTGFYVMAAVIFCYCFGSCVAYLIIVGDSFQPLLLEAFGASWSTGRSGTIINVACSFILPLCFKTRLGKLKAVSSVAALGLMTVTVIIVVRSAQIITDPGYSWDPVQAATHSLSFLTALPIIFFGFQCHTNVVSVWQELEPHPAFFSRASACVGSSTSDAAAEAGSAVELRQSAAQAGGGKQQRSDKLAGMARVIAVALALTAVFYSCVGLAGYLAFPASVLSNVTLNFPADDPLIQAARATVGLIQITAYPVNHFPARVVLQDVVQAATGHAPASAGFVAAETLLFFGATLGLALALTDLGTIFKLLGGTCGAVLILAMPGALLIQHARLTMAQAGQEAANGLHEPLLHGSSDAEAEAQAGLGADNNQPSQPAVCQHTGLRGSTAFWCGVALLVLSATLGTLTVATTLHPLPPT